MSESGRNRRLSAILAADVAGYTKLVEQDTDGTVAAWKAARTETVDPAVAKHSGRLVKLTGDGFLAEFSTVQDAVACAIAMQDGLWSSPLDFRMGINLGDVVDDGEDIHGEGVNIAARIEALAPPGGINISGLVYEAVRNRIEATFEDLGEQEVKHVSAPVRVFSVSTLDTEIESDGDVAAALTLPDKPSIAVLPFVNMSDDPEQEFFADGIAEDVITTLSCFRSLFVIARNSSFTYKGNAVDITQVSRELGVRYVVEGSVRKAGNRVRVTAQLIDALSGNHLWADRFDGTLEDVFDLQDRITEQIVLAVAPEVEAHERERARRKPPENLDAWELFQRGLWHFYKITADDNLEARQLFQRATDLDPNFSSPHAGVAYTHFFDRIQGYVDDPDASLIQGLAVAERAVALDDKDAFAQYVLGRLLNFNAQSDRAIATLEKAVALNPNYAQGHYALGSALNWDGRAEEAVPKLDLAMRLSPQDPMIWAPCRRTWRAPTVAWSDGATPRNGRGRRSTRDPICLKCRW